MNERQYRPRLRLIGWDYIAAFVTITVAASLPLQLFSTVPNEKGPAVLITSIVLLTPAAIYTLYRIELFTTRYILTSHQLIVRSSFRELRIERSHILSLVLKDQSGMDDFSFTGVDSAFNPPNSDIGQFEIELQLRRRSYYSWLGGKWRTGTDRIELLALEREDLYRLLKSG